VCALGWEHRNSRGLFVSCLLWLYLLLSYLTIISFFCFISLDTVESEMSLIQKNNIDWFLTLDETHHKFLTVSAKGGAAVGRYINPSFPFSGD
jgi:hypothetical protein